MLRRKLVDCNSPTALSIPSAIGVPPFSDRDAIAFVKILASRVKGETVLTSKPKLTTAN